MQKKKKLLGEIFGIYERLLTQNSSNQDLQLSWFFRPYGRLLENPKTGGSSELFMPENDFKTSSAKFLMPKDPTKMWNMIQIYNKYLKYTGTIFLIFFAVHFLGNLVIIIYLFSQVFPGGK